MPYHMSKAQATHLVCRPVNTKLPAMTTVQSTSRALADSDGPDGDAAAAAAVGPPYAALALSLVSQPWPDLGLDLDLLHNPPPQPSSSPSTAAAAASAAGVASCSHRRILGVTPPSAETDDISPLVERIVSLLLVRIVALVNTSDATAGDNNGGDGSEHRCSLVDYPDLSTATIARTELDRAAHAWPQPSLTAEVIRQLREYVHRICSNYRAVHYHNVEHCYHVTLSASKLLDMMLCEQPQQEEEEEDDMGGDHMGEGAVTAGATTTEAFRERQQRRRRQQLQRDNDTSTANGNTCNNAARQRQHRGKMNTKKRKLYGLRNDALTHLAFVFSALIHDVDHTGITNRQLVDEADDLALLYNDQSVAEQRSLAVAFSTLLSPDFDRLRDVMFATREDYQRFRGVVIDLVLATDIASPE